ncbi:MAG: glycosyltransferase family 4 protein [Thermodesulfovibrionia bacterium]|nr:glycosyltransferase family 4 protein [Thermodesulfovibrionia bacterium]
MNILQINNNHFIIGGAATYYFMTAELLEKHGHKSYFFSMHWPKNFPCDTSEYFMPYVDLNAEHSLFNQLKIAGRILYSFEARSRLSDFLDRYPVDIAHLHNIYHGFSPSILHELKKRKIPIVMTLHDYKLVCGSYILFLRGGTRGHICEKCSDGKYFMTVKNRCVKESYKKSILTALEMYFHHKILDIYRNVDIFIAPSLFLKNKFEEMGFTKEIVNLPYFIDTEKLKKYDEKIDSQYAEKGNYIIYAGRLSVEKGLLTLLDAVKLLYDKKKDFEIRIAGEGPMNELLQKKVREDGIDNVRFLGFLKSEEVYHEMKGSLAAVLPSEWYDNYPMSIIETFAMGVPLIGARIGGIPEMVIDNETGLTFEPGNAQDLCQKLEYVLDNPGKVSIMGRNARAFVEKNLNAEDHYEKLIRIYQQAIHKNTEN